MHQLEIDIAKCSVQELEKIHAHAEKELEKALLDGADWKIIQEKSQTVTELAIILHKRKYPLINNTPAENNIRQ